MRDNIKPSLMDTAIIPRKQKKIYHQPESIFLMANQVESLKNALDNIRQICENENIRPKMKLCLVETISGLALGLNDD